ncbi:alpha-amylase [Ligilactobacillus salitolerans]|uniref:Alpha-amylase n=1 Tax=Ligilactobacillus salitolerans TaxID=1808352 RepID=A0A401IVB6_9LACO|nr:alpha amylase N-terminal ig-like domain-containing protein [Ligilactobacillus salitolerans]GBG95472.1 alpha-amylase [Ligilactobacillus salitolerans]
MEKSAIFHNSQSAMAFETGVNSVTIRLKSKHDDLTRVELLYSDLYAPAADNGGWRPHVASMKRVLQSSETDYWSATVELSKTRRLKYAFHLIASSGEEYLYDFHKIENYTANSLMGVAAFVLPYSYPNQAFKQSAWTQNTVWYHLLIDRFSDGDSRLDPADSSEWGSEEPTDTNFFGGDLQGIRDRLDYIAKLGVNGLILSPIFAAFSNHKYDTADFYSIDQAYGSKETFKRLVDDAHQHGMRIVLELELDHLMDFSIQWQDVKQKGTDSQFFDWFLIDSLPLDFTGTEDPAFSPDISYRVHANNPHEPKLNLRNRQVLRYWCDLANYWVESFDIDGFKIMDPEELDPSFLQSLTASLHRLKPALCLLGTSNSFTPNLLEERSLDVVVDQDLTQILADYFITQKTNAAEMVVSLNDNLMKYATPVQKSLILQLDGPFSSRLLAQCQEDPELVRLLLAFSYLLPVSPSLYYGTEVGLKGGDVPANRECLPWKAGQQDQTMLRFVKLLGEFHARYSMLLKEGTLDWGQLSNKNNFVSFTRRWNGKCIFALFNLGYGSIKFVFPPQSKLLISQNLLKDQNRIGHNGFVIVEA